MQRKFQPDQIQRLACAVSEREMRLDEALALVTSGDGEYLCPSAQTFKRYCKSNSIALKTHAGRPSKPVREDIAEIIKSEKDDIKSGAMMSFYSLVRMGHDVSRNDVYKIFRLEGLFKYEKPKNHVLIRCRYEACQRDLIWHIDLHQHVLDGVQKYVMAFIDDASRLVINWDLRDNKTAAGTTKFLEDTLRITFPIIPYAIWSDNGGEFMGDFDDALTRHGIQHAWTDAYNPEQNGKIERFWGNFAEVETERHLGLKFGHYNSKPHTGLPTIMFRNVMIPMTPAQRYESLPAWTPERRTWLVDNIEKAFEVKRKRK